MQQLLHHFTVLHFVQGSIETLLCHSVLFQDSTPWIAVEVVEHEAKLLIAELGHIGRHRLTLIGLGGKFRSDGVNAKDIQFGAYYHQVVVIGGIVEVTVRIDVGQRSKGEIDVAAVVVQVNAILAEVQTDATSGLERRYVFHLDKLDILAAVVHRVGSQRRVQHPHQIYEAGIGRGMEIVGLDIHGSRAVTGSQLVEVALTSDLHHITSRHDFVEVGHGDIRHTGQIAVEA